MPRCCLMFVPVSVLPMTSKVPWALTRTVEPLHLQVPL